MTLRAQSSSRPLPTSVDPVLCVALSHPHPLVRGAALAALDHRALAPFEAALVERLAREPEAALRVTVVRHLKALAATSPDAEGLAEVLAEVAAKDPAADVRAVAATAAAE